MPEGPDGGAPVHADPPDRPGADDPSAGSQPLDPRFTLANERTFLAWVRTALALVVAGLAVTQLFGPFSVAGGRRIIGLPLIALGAVVSFWCFRRWQVIERAMILGRAVPVTRLPLVVAGVVGVVAVVGVVFVLVGHVQ
jgi:putative membrane protein